MVRAQKRCSEWSAGIFDQSAIRPDGIGSAGDKKKLE